MNLLYWHYEELSRSYTVHQYTIVHEGSYYALELNDGGWSAQYRPKNFFHDGLLMFTLFSMELANSADF